MAQATGSLAQLWGSNSLKPSQHPPNTVPTPGYPKNLTQAKDGLTQCLLSHPNYCSSLPLHCANTGSSQKLDPGYGQLNTA